MERMHVLVPIERDGKKTFWLRLGRAFRNKDGSINVYLDALPAGGKLQLRDADEERETENGNGARAERGGRP